MTELVFSSDDYATVRDELIGGETERCAVLFATQFDREDGVTRLLVRDFEFPAPGDYTRKGLLEAELTPEFVARCTKRARREGSALIFAHSHPGTNPPVFSKVDNAGEEKLAAFLAHRHPGVKHAALLISAGGLRARGLGGSENIGVISLGSTREVLFSSEPWHESASEVFDRQVRVFGRSGQSALQRLRVAIVGLGGTGSLIAQQLVHLGVRDFILVDPDVLETTNLNRVSNATKDDLNKTKVDIAARYIHEFATDAVVSKLVGDVIQEKTASRLRAADLIFGCTDSHGSRAVLQQVSYQYMIPMIDMGVTIALSRDRISHIYGRVQLLAPGLACLTCDGLLNSNEVRKDMMTAFERKADPYIDGEGEPTPAPAVMSLNSTVSSLSVTMMLSMVTGMPIKGRHLLYNAMSSSLRTVRAAPKADCYICSRSGSFARGDSWPLFTRKD